MRSAELHIAEGKCEKWTKPLDRNSVRERTEHLETHRQRDARYRQKKRKKGIEPGTNGRQPGTLKALAASREKKSLALLAPWHQAEARGRQSERSQAPSSRSARQSPCNEADSAFPTGRGQASFRQRRGNGRPSNCSRLASLSAWARAECRSLIGTARDSNRSGETCRKDGRISAFIQHLDQGKRDA